MRSQTKIAIIFFIASLSFILLLSISVYYLTTQYSFTDFYARLQLRAVFAARLAFETEDEKTTTFKEIREQHLEQLLNEKPYFFEIKPDKSFYKEAEKLNLPLSFFKEILIKGKTTYQNKNTFFSGLKYKSKEKDYIVIVSANNYYNTHHLANMRRTFFIAIPLVSFFALLISFFLSRKIFTPVSQITDKVKQISSENMHLRLVHTNMSNSDEIGDLIVTFNDMLDRLETAFETQNNFISNASHELSTPLTAIIGEADVTLNKLRSPEEYAESLRLILNEAERLDKITKSLLFLAQTGFDGKKQQMGVVRTDQLLWDVKETIDKINPSNQIFIDLDMIPENPENLKIKGNMQLLHLALTNIVSNACKYSSNKPVKVAIGSTGSHVVIIVKDLGIGIPEEELKYIYDPFFRASNSRNYEGYGIGLPLALNIIRMHQGNINVISKINEGTTVQLTFPLGGYRIT